MIEEQEFDNDVFSDGEAEAISPSVEEYEEIEYIESDLQKKLAKDLKEICKDRGYSQQGSKTDLIKRILTKDQGTDNDWSPDIVKSDKCEVKKNVKTGLRNKSQPKRPYDSFSLLFSSDIIDLIVNQTRLYIKQNDLESKAIKILGSEVNCYMIYAFLSITIQMGICTLPSISYYWSETNGYEPVQRIMPRSKFMFLHSVIHLADNKVDDKTDAFFKVREYLNLLLRNYQEHWYPSEIVTIDEDMIPSNHQHDKSKQYPPNKPNKWGFRVWKLVDSNGYMYNMDFYQGKNPINENSGKMMGSLGESVVKQLMEPIIFKKN
ncbi:hypothetical protein DLAC_10890 [Tieghemostelium lacteum]|uniref:Uncharacterized protein n=1 Tax=Tieghemostelium lacteum TaxID=361077 RepID=A0A151Z318_TIELA|nr:hypothetical protein DLAC_10890 [Tieghemostelium lacteum]|eukprot:KYQ88204.1 hypothetical protein DLAC_10890 [Tieghemostelium lacteum]